MSSKGIPDQYKSTEFTYLPPMWGSTLAMFILQVLKHARIDKVEKTIKFNYFQRKYIPLPRWTLWKELNIYKTFAADIDECSGDLGYCHKFAECTNTAGSYVCQCMDGYHGDGTDNCQGKLHNFCGCKVKWTNS